MKKWLSVFLSSFLWLAGAPKLSAQEVEKAASPAPAVAPGGVALIPLKGEINATQATAFKTALAKAEADKASGVVVEIDSTGGSTAAALEVMDALLVTKTPTVAFVAGKALSSASLVALGAKKIYVHPTAVIGAGGLDKGDESVVSKARAAAKANGHPEDVAEAFVRVEAEVKRGETVFDSATTYLSLSANEAVSRHYGHPLLATAVADSAQAAAQLAGLSAATAPVDYVAPASLTKVVVGQTEGPVFVIPIKDAVNEPQFYFLRRALKEAQRAKASAIILDIDTPGGLVFSAMNQMDALLATTIPTIAYVNKNALSAGSLISLATDKIYMHSGAVIGASAVVSGGGEDLNKTMGEKVTSVVVAKARGTAKANGHPEDVAEAFVRIESEVIRDGVTIDNSAKLLSLNAPDAAKMYGGKPLLAAGIADDIEGVIRAAGLKGEVKRLEPSGFESFAHWITTLAPLLLMAGLALGYMEFKIPGFGLPGIASLVCFALYFWGHLIAGLAGMESVVLFLLGLVLVLLEIFVFPGTLISGLIGVLFMLAALVWAMVDQWPTEGGDWVMPSGEQLERPIFNLVLGLIGTAVAIAFLAKVLPKTSLYGRLVLANAVPAGPGITVPVVNLTVKVGDTGTAATTLRPAGKADIGGETHDVVSDGGYIESGTPIRVVSTDGMRVVVEPA